MCTYLDIVSNNKYQDVSSSISISVQKQSIKHHQPSPTQYTPQPQSSGADTNLCRKSSSWQRETSAPGRQIPQRWGLDPKAGAGARKLRPTILKEYNMNILYIYIYMYTYVNMHTMYLYIYI